MANGHGGSRPGSGRKPKSALGRALDGGAGHRSPKVVPHPSVPAPASADPFAAATPAADEINAPDEFTPAQRCVWIELAPHAIENGTLTKATVAGFKILCKNVALEREYSSSVMDRGGPNHRGLIQRIDAELLRFNLAPCGKPVAGAAPVAPPVDPLKARYFGGR